MNPEQLEIANLAAEYDFGKTELVGYYHNEVINFIVQKLPGRSPKMSVKKIVALGEKYFLSLPENAFGKIPRKKYEAIVQEAKEANYDPKNVSFTWKKNPALSEKANQKLAELFKQLRLIQKGRLSVKEIKQALVSWQNKIGKLSETEFVILSGAGSIARHSAAYWEIKEPVTPPGPISARKRCLRVVAIVCADIGFGIAGGIAGAVAGGPVGAAVGAATFGGMGSGAVALGTRP